MYTAYILRCADGTYYAGSTNDVERRLVQHNTSKSGAHYTKIRRPVVLVYKESFDTYAQARSAEARYKRLTRTQKEQLINQKSL